MAIDEFGQAGIGLDGKQPRPVVGEPAHMLGHLLRPRGAVDADERHVEGAHHRRGCGDVGADKQRAGGFDRHLDEDRLIAARRRARALGAVDRGLDLQRVLAGLDQERIDAAGDEAAALLGERVLERRVLDMAERGEPRARPDRAEHEARPPVALHGIDRLARDLGRAPVEREGLIAHPDLAQGDGRGAEAVGLDRVGAGAEMAEMNVAHQVGAALAQDVGEVLLAAIVALDIELQRLHLGAHRAVAEQHALGQDVEDMRPSVTARHERAPRARRSCGRSRRSGRRGSACRSGTRRRPRPAADGIARRRSRRRRGGGCRDRRRDPANSRRHPGRQDRAAAGGQFLHLHEIADRHDAGHDRHGDAGGRGAVEEAEIELGIEEELRDGARGAGIDLAFQIVEIEGLALGASGWVSG